VVTSAAKGPRCFFSAEQVASRRSIKIQEWPSFSPSSFPAPPLPSTQIATECANQTSTYPVSNKAQEPSSSLATECVNQRQCAWYSTTRRNDLLPHHQTLLPYRCPRCNLLQSAPASCNDGVQPASLVSSLARICKSKLLSHN